MNANTRDITFHTPQGPRVGYLATPATPPKGALVVVHEIFGRAPEMERATVRLANAGYAALMPDLFGERFKLLCIRQALQNVKQGKGEYIDVLRAAADAVAQESRIPRARVAVVGFCMGAGLALAVGNAFAAVNANYGEVPPTEVLRGIGPTVACYGGRDRANLKNIDALRDRLTKLDVKHEVHVFENAGHAFMSDGDHPVAEFFTRALLDVNPARDAADRDQAWTKVLSFLETHAAMAATTG